MLNVVTAEEALELIMKDVSVVTEPECVPLEDSLGRTVASDIMSPEDLPPSPRSVVDGFAVIASDTFGCSESIPAILEYDGEILMGEMPEGRLRSGHCMKISTGGYLPEGADSVSMIEYTDDAGDEFRYVLKPLSVLENVNNKGDDARKGNVVVPEGTCMASKNIAICAALGIKEIPVCKKIRVGVISTGDELVEYDSKINGARIRNINSVMLGAQLKEIGCESVLYPIVKDETEDLEQAVSDALKECDALLISGGSSAGDRDRAVSALESLGSVKFHGISIKPGKPTIFAVVDGKPVFSLPGHPQAAYFIFRLFAAPALLKMSGREWNLLSKKAVISQNIPSNHGREEIVSVVLNGDSAVPIHSKSGVVSVLSKATGYIRVPRNTEGLKKGDMVNVFLL